MIYAAMLHAQMRHWSSLWQGHNHHNLPFNCFTCEEPCPSLISLSSIDHYSIFFFLSFLIAITTLDGLPSTSIEHDACRETSQETLTDTWTDPYAHHLSLILHARSDPASASVHDQPSKAIIASCPTPWSNYTCTYALSTKTRSISFNSVIFSWKKSTMLSLAQLSSAQSSHSHVRDNNEELYSTA